MLLRIWCDEKLTVLDAILPFIGFTLLTLLICNWRTIYLTWKFPKTTAFRHFPLIGHIGILKYVNPTLQTFMELNERLSADSGCMLSVPGFRSISVHSVEHMEVVLTHPHTQKKHYIYDFFAGFIGDTIFRIHGPRWKANRKALSPTMHPETIAPYVEDMATLVGILVDKVRARACTTFDAMPDIAKCLMDMFVNTSFGVNLHLQTDSTKFDHYTDVFLELAMVRMMTLIKHPDCIYRLTKDHRIQEDALVYGRKFTDRIFTDRKNVFEKELEERKLDANIEAKTPRKRKFIDHLLEMEQDGLITEQDARNEVNTFMIAGFDTCTSGVSFTLIALAMHPEMQEKAYEEVIDVLGAERCIEYADLSKLVYLEKVIKESLRIFPPIPVIARVSEHEFQLDGHTVPENTQLRCSIIETQRSPLYWRDPLQFNPHRFDHDAVLKHVKHSYMPFLIGPRTCFGTRVAWLSLKITIATLLRRFRMYTPYKNVSEIKLLNIMTLKAADGIQLRFEERNVCQ